jgi:hypothetical protein
MARSNERAIFVDFLCVTTREQGAAMIRMVTIYPQIQNQPGRALCPVRHTYVRVFGLSDTPPLDQALDVSGLLSFMFAGQANTH